MSRGWVVALVVVVLGGSTAYLAAHARARSHRARAAGLPALRWYAGSGAPGEVAVGFLGDSITHDRRGGVSPGEAAASLLGVRAVVCAVSGSTTHDWLGTPRFAMAVAAFRRADVGLVSVMLGTNDSRDDRRVPAAVYRVRLGAIEVALREAGFRVVVQTPPVTANARFDAPLLASYLGAGMRVSMVDGVHPDAAGVRALGAAWAVSVGRALER